MDLDLLARTFIVCIRTWTPAAYSAHGVAARLLLFRLNSPKTRDLVLSRSYKLAPHTQASILGGDGATKLFLSGFWTKSVLALLTRACTSSRVLGYFQSVDAGLTVYMRLAREADQISIYFKTKTSP